MKRQIPIVLALLLGFALPMMAQNNKVEARIQLARDQYAKGLANIASVKPYMEEGVPNVNYLSVVRHQNWAGSGQCADKMDFYYEEVYEPDDEYQETPIAYRPVMIRRNKEMYEGGPALLEEYVFDDEGRPLFWFTSYFDWSIGHGGSRVELRQYYDEKGEVIRTICKTTDESGETKVCGKENFEDNLNRAIDDFNRFKSVFDAIYN